MTQKEKLETLTGEKFPDPTPQEQQRIQIPGTPFWAIGNKEKGYNLIMGKYKLTSETITDLEKLNQWLIDNQWKVTLSMIICATTDIINNQNKQ